MLTKLLGVSAALVQTPRYKDGPHVWSDRGKEVLRACWYIHGDQVRFWFDGHLGCASFERQVAIHGVDRRHWPQPLFVCSFTGKMTSVLLLVGDELMHPTEKGLYGNFDQHLNFGEGPIREKWIA